MGGSFTFISLHISVPMCSLLLFIASKIGQKELPSGLRGCLICSNLVGVSEPPYLLVYYKPRHEQSWPGPFLRIQTSFHGLANPVHQVEDFHEVASLEGENDESHDLRSVTGTPTAQMPEVRFLFVVFDKNGGSSLVTRLVDIHSPSKVTLMLQCFCRYLHVTVTFEYSTLASGGQKSHQIIPSTFRSKSKLLPGADSGAWDAGKTGDFWTWGGGIGDDDWNEKHTGVAFVWEEGAFLFGRGVGKCFVWEEGGKRHCDWLKGMMKPWFWKNQWWIVSSLCEMKPSEWSSQKSGCRVKGKPGVLLDWMVPPILIKRVHDFFCRGLTGFDLHLGILTNGYHANDALIKCISFQICLCWVRILNFVVGYVWFLMCVEKPTT